MPYKVFLVEDEIVTREGIRDNVDWRACGFEFCGDAADGEMALPLLRSAKPDALITDIKMPFMDGLQLSKIVRERMPSVKIIILSGHDEFEYAQEAINLGVTDYLLKPVTVQKLHSALNKLAALLDQERKEQENLKYLQDQVEENRAALRERLLLRLILGAVTPTEAEEQGHLLGLDLIARYYLVAMVKLERKDRTEPFDYAEYQRVQDLAAGLADKNPDVFLLKKDLEDLILIMKGNTPEYLEEERDLLLDRIRQGVIGTGYQVRMSIGATQKRIADIRQSFLDALVNMQTPLDEQDVEPYAKVERAELLKMDRLAVDHYLRSGRKEDFEEFFNAYLRPLSGSVTKSSLIKNYIMVDLLVTASRFVVELGGEVERIIPEPGSVERILREIKTEDHLRDKARDILTLALSFRDHHASEQYHQVAHRAKRYIDQRYTNPELSLNEVAAQVSLSASHFSVVFSQQTQQTFKEYLTEVRIKRAKELLRLTNLRSAEIAYQVGYSDPHYFSSVFKRNTGMSPIEFRAKFNNQQGRER